MIEGFLSVIGRLYSGIMSILISVLLGVTLWIFCAFYREEALDSRFRQEGSRVLVTIEQTSSQARSWRDQFGNVSYLTFRYRQQPYTVRFVLDTIRAGEGDRVSLLYHSGLDAFRQPGPQFRFNQAKGTSRLIHWSVVIAFSPERKLLILCVVLGTAFFLFASGTIISITGWHFLPGMGYPLLIVLLLGGTAFLTYDSWQYVQYYGQLKAHSRPTEATVISTDRSSYYSRGSRHWKSYLYTAWVQFEGRQRIIPLEEETFGAIRPGDSLPVLYAPSLDDLMPVDYAMDHRQFYALVIAWLLTLYWGWRKITRPAKKPQPN